MKINHVKAERVAWLLHWFDVPTKGYLKGLCAPKAGTFNHPDTIRAERVLREFRNGR